MTSETIPRRPGTALPLALLRAPALAARGGGSAGVSPAPQAITFSAAAALDEKIFADPSLRRPVAIGVGRQSYASCHDPDPDRGHSPPNGSPSTLGGPTATCKGRPRRWESATSRETCRSYSPPTARRPAASSWMGLPPTFAEQATEPFLNPFEMANADKASVIAKLAERRRATRAGSLQLAGKRQVRRLSSIDARRRRRAAAGHRLQPRQPRRSAQPRIARNADPAYFDLGLCQRADLAERRDLCGAFKVPTLRNVALRQAFFQNGRFKTPKDALTFYVQRDTNSEKWYPLAGDGRVRKFDDLPPQHRVNVNTREAPYDRRPGDSRALWDAEIDDVIAFLKTLSDGYVP